MADGFAAIEQHLKRLGRPVPSLAACELRSPRPMTVDEFRNFNAGYVATLRAMGCQAGEVMPAGRSNFAPILEVPTEPLFAAFAYTMPESDAAGDFLISGKPENREGATGSDRFFGGNDVSQPRLLAKGKFVMDALRARVDALGCDWSGITGTQVYTVHDLRPLLESLFAPAGLTQNGITWFSAWPPVVDLHFEVDVRRVRTEIIL